MAVPYYLECWRNSATVDSETQQCPNETKAKDCSISVAKPPTLSTTMNTAVNPYHILEIRKDATPSEVVLSYRKLALLMHPGRKSKITSPLERKLKMERFEVLAACYETLIHNGIRRRYDTLLKETENKEIITNRTAAATSTTTTTYNKNLIRSKPVGLTLSSTCSSNSEGADASIRYTNCNNAMLICASPTDYDDKVLYTIPTRDDTKGFKSLADSSALFVSHSQGSEDEDEEAEIQYTEKTVNRLFGGPLSVLHRARNFKPFSDPYEIFNKVFGNESIFRPVKLTDINVAMNTSAENLLYDELFPINENAKNCKTDRDDKSTNDHLQQQHQTTKVFVSSRVLHGRKITKTETVHIDPITSRARVDVTVDGEYLADNSKAKQPSQSKKVGDWLLCFGTATAKYTHSTTMKESIQNNDASDGNDACKDFKSIYVEILEEFYLCNKNFYDECNRYMSCSNIGL